MRKAISVALTLVMAMITLSLYAQAPQTGVYRIQNVGSQKYIKVNGRYDATPNQTSQQDASYITVGIEKKLDDGTYKVNSLASTYGEDNTRVEVYDYITKALTLGEIELRKILANSSEENVQRAINTMHQIAKEYGFMRMMPVDGQANTYHAVAVLPEIPDSVVIEWRKKVSEEEFPGTMWDWCKKLVLDYLEEHDVPGGTDPGLISKIRNNLDNIYEGHTYLLKDDNDGSFGFIDTGKNGPRKSDNEFSMWKLTPKVNNENVKDGTYKVRNLGKQDANAWVKIESKYYARPNYSNDDASEIRITFDGTNEKGDQKIINLGGKAPDGSDIDIYSYIEKAIRLGKVAIADVLSGEYEGVNQASGPNIIVAQETMEKFVKENAFMSIKPVDNNDEAVYAYAYIPEVPSDIAEAMYNHGAFNGEGYNLPQNPTIPDLQAAAWKFGVNYVKQYLGSNGTDNTLKSYILANIENINPGTTYYLSAHQTDGTFDYAAEGQFEMTDPYFQWGFDVEEVEEDNLTSGTYQIRNVQYENFVHVISKYYAKPDADGEEVKATDIHITYSGKLDDGSYKVTNMSAVAEDGSLVDIADYIQKAIRLGKIAIADVLSGKEEGPNVHVASDENIEYAQQYLEDFVNENAYMRVKPVAGTNYVYAIATIPEIPEEVVTQMVNHIDGVNNAEDCWQYGVDYVMNYLDGHPNSSLVALVTNNINKIKPGHTYYLSEDEDGTFGYIDDSDPDKFDLTNKAMQWGVYLEEEDQPVESDFYKIHNVGNDKYVKVEGRYYARPAYTEEEATPIAVTIAEGQLEDGSYKVTNLVGDGHDIQKYVQHAIELGIALIHELLDNVSTEEHVNQAIEEMTNFVNENAYMRVKLVPGETEAYYAYVVLPTVPQYIVDEWRKKVPESEFSGSMRDWAVAKVKNYLNTHDTDPKLKSMILNNIDKLYEGHTYYLRADGDDTFGIGDFTDGEVDLINQYYWWGFADAIKAEPVNGYFRVKGKDGKYVNVTGKFAATPDADETKAKSAAGTVIYVGTGDTKDTKTLPLEILRSQGVDVGSYMTMINDVMVVVAGTAGDLITNKLENAEEGSEFAGYSQYAGLVKPMIQTLLESVDLNLYIEPTITSDGKNAYMLEVNVPDLKEYCDLALDALSLMGKSKQQLVEKLQRMEEAETNATIKKLYNIAWRTAQYLDDPDEMWNKLKENAIPYVQTYFINNAYDEALGVSGGVMGKVGQLIINALENPDFNYGTTYCLRQDADGTFGYASRENLINDDAAKWILESFDTEDPNYDESSYVPFVVSTKFTQESYNSEGKPTGDTYNYTTTYLDFEAQIETTNAAAFTVTATERYDLEKTKDGVTTTKVYYLATLTPVEGNVPAATPVVLRSDADGDIELRPVSIPTHPAVESAELDAVKRKIIELFQNKVNGMTTHNAPSIRVISETTEDNILVGSFFDEEIKSADANTYLALDQKKKVESGDFILDMDGLGFWKDNVSELEGNKAYLYGVGQEEFFPKETFEQSTVGSAPGYIFQYKDNTYTSIKEVNTLKEVKSVRYYNTLGIESNTPFEGVNIIVTTFTDGTKATTKVIK